MVPLGPIELNSISQVPVALELWKRVGLPQNQVFAEVQDKVWVELLWVGQLKSQL
jgi:hypothetical protein